MRILHTSDWHLGKYLEIYQRLEEQELFIDELELIADEQNIDLIIIAGDIYDVSNPPSAAEQLFYRSMKRLSKEGVRPILIIAGNHDNPERLTAANPLATELGIIMLGTVKSVVQTGDYGKFKIIAAGEGHLELEIHGERIVILAMPYPSEKRLNQILCFNTDEQELQISYSRKIGEIFESLQKYYRDDSINIATGHFFITGGQSSNTERDIQLGGSYAVNTGDLPQKAQYIAMGHLHRQQKAAPNTYYSGSPIQLGKSESGYAKCVLIADIEPGKEAIVEKIYLNNYKPVELWKAESIEAAIELCESRSEENSYIYLEIKTDRPLLPSEIKLMRTLKKDIVEINPLLEEQTSVDEEQYEERGIAEEFSSFYIESRKTAPSNEIIDLFLKLYQEEEML